MRKKHNIRIEGVTPRKSEPTHTKSLAEHALYVVLIGGVSIGLGRPCLGQEVQRVEGSPTSAASQSGTQSSTTGQAPQTSKPEQSESESKKKGKLVPRGSFLVAPLPISSPAIGTGIVPVLGYIFPFNRNDKISPPSVVGVAGLVTNNGSRGFAVGGQLYLKENTYRITAGFAHGNVDYDIYGIGFFAGRKLPLNQTGQAFLAEFLRRVGWKFFTGPRFITGRSFLTVSLNNPNNFPIPPNIGLHTTLTAVGAKLTRDTSPNRFYPTSGTFFSFTSDFFSQALGSKYSFQSYKTTFSKYWSLRDSQVLAYNAYFCGTGGGPPFYGNCIYGTDNELRGYTAGQYFTRYALATQLEYRLVLPKRLGLVVFGGVGEAIPSGIQLYGSRKFLPSGGGGLRFTLSKKYHVNLRADLAQSRDGHTFGMGVGEAF
jgi:Omp85 superfamily domain